MAITYNWDFGPISVRDNVNGLNNVVALIVWRCVAKDSDTNFEASESGYTELSEPNPEMFVSVSDLTKDHILSWIGSEKRQEVEGQCLQYLNNILSSNTREIRLELD